MIASKEPELVVAGDTWTWRRDDLSDYPASAWTLTFYVSNASGKLDAEAVADGDAFVVTFAAANTAGLAAGTYRLEGYVVNGAERYRIYTGSIEVEPNLASAGNIDARSHAEKALDAIQAVIEGRASKDQISYTIEGRTLSRTPIEDLLRLRDVYRREVSQERARDRIRSGRPAGRSTLVRF